MKIISAKFKNLGEIPDKYSNFGENVNPPLEFVDVPSKTESLVLIVDDPDADKVGGFDHWILCNINPKVKKIDENSVPKNSIECINDFGLYKYSGPAPPRGKKHKYFFKLYAIDAVLDIDRDFTKKEIIALIEDDIIDHAELVGTFQK